MAICINFQNGEFYAATYTVAGGYLNGSIDGLLEDALKGHQCSSFQGDMQEALDALQDGELLQAIRTSTGCDEDALQEQVENLHSVVGLAILDHCNA